MDIAGQTLTTPDVLYVLVPHTINDVPLHQQNFLVVVIIPVRVLIHVLVQENSLFELNPKIITYSACWPLAA